jgi:orotidine-5'-phosphate decarboxylase
MNPAERLVVALDRSGRDEILSLADSLRGTGAMLKIGLQAFVSNGPSIVRELAGRGEKIFLDLKFHDIPNTASHAVAEALELGAAIVNVHASGGRAMLQACAEKVKTGGSKSILLGVTVLTSLAQSDLSEIGVETAAEGQVVRLALLCRETGVDGVVASPQEITAIREACGEKFVILTPGIRAASDARGDQKRTLTASQAIARGADLIVVGRPITEASSPREAALRIIEEIATAREGRTE